ncbi:hypothetical protein LEMA_P052420.1 [Plenodomus lingam JN3]|uniref:Uncharacterized protein n=1 Tax=Leptosphaeria maculans (strain JN3 / isolate v23.1.3 / race Av1-4-5-6-7-8) TaxID=985895 RepID=E4ZMT3_LEPMJ|nr:hypothetical protein LEMA_P052420.1 [Plenodomus lingam JN3]CBX92536.1 hypothetical protein LEMA_P052420.1 [Plenodomus lingam JN3]
MKPGRLPLRAQPRPRPVCQLCDYILQQPASRRPFLAASSIKAPGTPPSYMIRRTPARLIPRIVPARSITTTVRKGQELEDESNGHLQMSDRIAMVRAKLESVESQIREIYRIPKVPTEAVILGILDELDQISQLSIAIRSGQPPPTNPSIQQSSAGAILSGLRSDENTSTHKVVRKKSLGFDALPSPSYLSKLAEDLIKNEKVFISPDILGHYIYLQRLLARPKTIPEALYLYAHKPVPEEGSSPPKFSKPSPKSVKQAVPADLANDALTAAIQAKDLSLALAVVDQTYRTPAWRRHRMITKMGLPAAIASLTPLAIYMVAQELSVYSGYIDPAIFKLYAFLGMSTYVLCTGTLGFVAWTTHNDHHDRVVWRPGVPLLDRFLHEDERAALDRIACAWGFKEEWRRGDEEGEEWEGLRQWILLRGMVLDKPDLMPGMNTSR